MEPGIQTLNSADAISACRNGAILVDVRTEEEFAMGHAEAAINIPFARRGSIGMSACPNFVNAVTKRFATDDQLVLMCAAGVRSRHAAHALAEAGFTNLIDAAAGMAGTRNAFGQVLEPGWEHAGGTMASE